MVAILQTEFWNAVSWIKIFASWLKLHQNISKVSVNIKLDLVHSVLATNRRQAIILTSDDLAYRWLYAYPGLSELNINISGVFHNEIVRFNQ